MKPVLLTKLKIDHDITQVKPVIIVGRDASKIVEWEEDEAKWRRIYGIKQYQITKGLK